MRLKRELFKDPSSKKLFKLTMGKTGTDSGAIPPSIELELGSLELEMPMSSRQGLLSFLTRFSETLFLALILDNLRHQHGKPVKGIHLLQEALDNLDEKIGKEFDSLS
ncbi:MAG: hypothetical protein A2402_03530 [Candidatus Staskawiczbacteria bacterium RIFOXYC1_FULL_37_43]|nr:MAG: hypothetical protein A2891_01855 [Candidatus Staskawiczbacteria bacterium RIFCSPLOWO2_01_FULL_37_19]OGZ75714.1 MAG: hypothetical protein A2205_02450 [Candidatus Staskawiczbacteria bacterium RIFOXYA1_FULL_37_15]OGZ82392.1 MAG: hypothetical protein A2402_03530 [Candidatus Staskawiczbacteria bacterium RIFOXYC1_FULL_37_43]OGZ86044.1 MAG: hypothetical protein A2490_02595 [Candidatus Staskawiczbacteria bacterium RIFOXYC12_FULL_39_20]OGZ90710.1 MAG: hypothetical protein A2601_03530 [Candidatus